MSIPHTFPSLLNPSTPPSILLIGAGMSYGIVPTAYELAQEICDAHNKIKAKLGIELNPPPVTSTGLYEWAEDAFNKLRIEKFLSDKDAKLLLADSMGITSDPRFHAKVGIPLRGNTPRHRVAARLAREDRWNTIWSLNWDCILETALESVGLLPHPNPATNLYNPLPWRRWYCTWSPSDLHRPAVAQPNILHVIKPHGCVNKLAEGKPLFIITTSEIGVLTQELVTVPGRMNAVVTDAPLVVVGWGAEEEYIHKNIEAIKQQGTLASEADRLSIIDPFWKPTPPSIEYKNHNRLAKTFGIDRINCHFPVSCAGNPTTDEFFQWLQTRYGLERMLQFTNAQNTGWNAEITGLQDIISQFARPNPSHWLNHFFDDFLAVWVRFCFNTSKVIYKNNSASVPQNVVATHRRDEHIPWGYGQTDRFDLLAAIPLTLALWQTAPTSESNQWNFEQFPGALWNENDGHLALPLPAWGETGQLVDKPIELAALKPLVDGWNWSRKGIIKRISILPLSHTAQYAPINDGQLKFRSSVAWLMKSSRFSDPTRIEVASLADI